MPTIKKEVLKAWLEEQEQKFNSFLNEMRKNKLKCLTPNNQGRIMASAGCIAFIREEIKYLDTLVTGD